LAVIVEATTVIVRRDAVRRAFEGEERAETALAVNRSASRDEQLYRITFFSDTDAFLYIRHILNANGLVYSRGDEAVDVTIAEQFRGLRIYTPWLEVGQLPVEEGTVAAAWLAGTEPGELITHAVWNYRGYSGLRLVTDETAVAATPSETQEGLVETFDPSSGKRLATLRTPALREAEAATRQPEPLVRTVHQALDGLMERSSQLLAYDGARTGEQQDDHVIGLRRGCEEDLAGIQWLIRNGWSGDPKTNLSEGYVLMALGRYHDAERPMRIADALAPHWSSAQRGLMVCLSKQGKTDEALVIGRHAARQHPTDPGIVLNFAFLLYRVGSDDEAIAVLDGLLAADPDHADANHLKRGIEAAMTR